ncbi:MAG: alpha-E domain-containing protein [Zetaproteobacteria bacterium]|nr:alpha-E domain-containing protein [Zetaproteobacteria bacterium]
MLSRTAQTLYQLGFLIERTENIARILGVNSRMSVEQQVFSDLDVWSPVLEITHNREHFETNFGEVNEGNVVRLLLIDSHNPYSVRACVLQAREIARSVRELISEELWLHINLFYHDMEKEFASNQLHDWMAFIEKVHIFANAFHGLAHNTMVRGDAWQFMRLGYALERGRMTQRILQIKYHLLLPATADIGSPLDLHQWQALLRSVSGYEAYRRLYQARIEPSRVIKLLMLNPSFPRSLHYCIHEVFQALRAIGMSNEEQFTVYRFTEVFLDDLRGGAASEEIIAMGIQKYLSEEVSERCGKLDTMIRAGFFDSVTVNLTDDQAHLLRVQIPQQQQMRTHFSSRGASHETF